MNKKYEYNGNIYCEDDLSEEIDNYGGSLFDLYWNLKEAGVVDEITYYYKRYAYDNCEFYKEYENHEDLIESEFCELEVEENE